MRVGFNPHKDQLNPKSEYFHQIIIPVYIPNHEDYFKDSFEILKLCLESLFLTTHQKTYITVVNNGSTKNVSNYLSQLYFDEKIQEVVETTDIGKLNSILKGLAGHNFPLITISDFDVLFLNNWQKETYSIFENFEKAGAVCPTPSSRSLRTYTSNIYWEKFFSKDLVFSDVRNPEALQNFANSVGNPNFYNKHHLEKYFTVFKNNKKAVIGAGHFVATYRGDIFDNIIKYSHYKLGGNSENAILDVPVVKKGLWRLSTEDNFAYHMGNVLEDWMYDHIQKLNKNMDEDSFYLKEAKSSSLLYNFIKNRLFSKVILNKKVMKYFIRWKGLNKEQAKDYLV